ncbi:NADH dehydrogenase [ubiquinone] 1 beta subcomplex subunit 2, mitochondrial-like [Amphiura filiformis]|uniref:NADH dehydrogenase [ubiquinone] 1 beta subcomplex subunit 2, mitochondrial-like n=1 Tax=Amphiura filiformis TaxID=82378 RepID=UPI003B21FAE0
MKSLLRLRPSINLLRRSTQTVPRRHGHIVYRDLPKSPKYIENFATFTMSMMWFWLMWRCYHEPEELTGHFPYPDPAKWSDEELGIPPDNED